MRLSPDCVRDTLMYLEEQLMINCKGNTFEFITLSQVTECMLIKYKKKYTEEDIRYTIYNLRQVHFIEGKFNDAGNRKMTLC